MCDSQIPKDQRQLARLAESLGWVIRRTGGGHFQWLSPDGTTIIVTHGTASDWRALRNMKAQLRRAGVEEK